MNSMKVSESHLEHEFDEGKRIDPQIGERRARIDLGGIERQLLDGAVLDAGEGVHAAIPVGERAL